jgi:enoyl-CoA hydratase/carnithine racemase
MADDEEPVLLEVAESIAVVTLNRPDRLNAWTSAMDLAYAEALVACDRDSDVRVIVVTGAGRAFSAGADVDMLRGMLTGGPRVVRGEGVPVLPELGVGKPIIAAINGACVGLSFVHALSCDIRVVAESAKLSTAFVRRGLVAEHGVSWLLSRAIGVPAAMDLLLSGRVFTGDEAVRLGLASRAVDADAVLDVSLTYARDLIVNCSPNAMRAIKRQVWQDLNRSFEEADQDADRLMEESFERPDFREGIESFLERRPPRFASLN